MIKMLGLLGQFVCVSDCLNVEGTCSTGLYDLLDLLTHTSPLPPSLSLLGYVPDTDSEIGTLTTNSPLEFTSPQGPRSPLFPSLEVSTNPSDIIHRDYQGGCWCCLSAVDSIPVFFQLSVV